MDKCLSIRNFRIQLIILFLIISYSCAAQKTVEVAGNPYRNLGKYIGYWEDTSESYQYDQVSKLPDSMFVIGTDPIFNGRTSGKAWWMKVRFTNAGGVKPYLVIDYANIDSIDIYYKDTAGITHHIRSGSLAPSDSRVYASAEYIFALPDVAGSPRELYIRVTSNNTLVVPIKLVEGITLMKALLQKYMIQLLFIGIVVSLFLFNLFMLLSTRDRLFGYYMIRIVFLFFLFVIAYVEGFGHFLGDNIKRFITLHTYAFAALGFIFTIIFNNSFLKVKRHLPGAVKVFNILIAAWILDILLSLAGFRLLTNRLMQALIFITSLTIMYSSIRIVNVFGYRKKYPLITFYVIGWVPISMAIFYMIPSMMGIFPLRDYSFKILSAAAMLEVLFITLALVGGRFRLLRDGKKMAEERNLRLIERRNIYLEEKIEERTTELKDSNAIKDKLLSIIAHDLRSPMSSLSAVLALSDDDIISGEEMKEMLKDIRKDTEKMQQTLENLLNWSLTQMGMQHHQPESIPALHFLSEHLVMYHALARKKEISVSIHCNEQIYVWADKNQLSLIVRNLIDNAIKFTPRGGMIEMGLKQHDGDYIMHVANSGPGISSEKIAQILGKQHGIEVSYGTANEKGTGLGLQLCKEFIQHLGSELEIQSEGGRTIFSFKVKDGLDKQSSQVPGKLKNNKIP